MGSGIYVVATKVGIKDQPFQGCLEGGYPGITTNSERSSSLCFWYGWLQRRSALARSANVSVAMQNMVGKFFHTMGRVSGIATRFYPLLSEGKIIPALARLPVQD